MLREISIPRDGKESVIAWLYWNGTENELAACTKLVLSVTGGGGVSMTPRCHDEYLIPWTKRLNIPILSIQYRFYSSFTTLIVGKHQNIHTHMLSTNASMYTSSSVHTLS